VASPSEKLSGVPLIDHAEQPVRLPDASLVLDTTAGSILHRAVGYGPTAQPKPPSTAATYITAIAFTYVPLLLVAKLSPLPLATFSSALHLPFLFDWNVAFMFMVSFPLLLVLTITDQHVLATIPRPLYRRFGREDSGSSMWVPRRSA
jgi:hypothetical protein